MCIVPAGPIMSGLSPFGPASIALGLPSTIWWPKRGVHFPETRLRAKASTLQTQRLDDSLGYQLLPGFATNAFENSAGDGVAEIRIVKLAASHMIERLGRGLFDHPITHFVHVSLLLVGAIDKIDQFRPVRQAARMGEQFLQRDLGELGIHLVLQFGERESSTERFAELLSPGALFLPIGLNSAIALNGEYDNRHS